MTTPFPDPRAPDTGADPRASPDRIELPGTKFHLADSYMMPGLYRFCNDAGDLPLLNEREARAFASALELLNATAGVPAGFVLVPREPKEEMIAKGAQAGVDAISRGYRRSPATYHAMIAAAPQPVTPAPETVAAPAVADLLEEVGYWRRDAAARMWSAQALMQAYRKQGRDDLAFAHREALRAAVGASEEVQSRWWHATCELCGKPLLPGEATCGSEDITCAHVRCAVEDALDDTGASDPTDDEWQSRTLDGRAALTADNEDPAAPPVAADATVEGDPLVWNLLAVNGERFPYATREVRGWCHQAADALTELRLERDEARIENARLTALLKQEQKESVEQRARAIAAEATLRAAWQGGASVDGACPACPVEVRDLFACAHNLIVSIGMSRSFGDELQHLKDAVQRFQPLVDEHFADRVHSHTDKPVIPARRQVAAEDARATSDHDEGADK